MKKNLLFVIVLCILLPCVAQAQLNNGYILMGGDSPSSYCLPMEQTLTLTANPTRGNLRVDVEGLTGNANMCIMNMQGQVVAQSDSFPIGDMYDVSYLSSGQYIVTLQYNNERYMGLFIKQ